MPIPIAYPQVVKGSFITPRTPPLPPKYSPPIFERSEMVRDRQNHHLGWLPDTARNHFIAMIGEFVGTTFFLFFSFAAVQTANAKPDNLPRVGVSGAPSLLQIAYISFAFGLSLMVNVWVFFRVSGGMFNPAVTIGLTLVGAVPVSRALLLIPIQIAGGIVAAAIVSGLFPGTLNVANTLGTGTSPNQGLFIELFMTAMLIFTILMLAVEKHRATPLAPVGIGATLALVHLIGINYTGTSVNPARTFGPCVVTGNFPTYHWLYWLGPILGAMVAVGFYKTIKFLEYESANPGQDDDGIPFYRVVSSHHHHRPQRSNSVTSLSPFAHAGA